MDDGSLERRVHVGAREGRGDGRDGEPQHPCREGGAGQGGAGEGGGARQRGVPSVRGDGAEYGGEDERGDAHSMRGGGGRPARVDAAGGLGGERGCDPTEDEREGGERVEAREARGGYRGLWVGVELDVDNLASARGRVRRAWGG